ncbi:MAG: hypothetical protein AABY18_01005 [Candidatus Thermoplasmatota archaeon]
MPSMIPPVFHPLVVHAPLILLPLAALAASLKRWWPWVTQAVPPLLIAAALSAVVAVGTGLLEKDSAQEEWEGTEKEDWISTHQILGIATAVAACLLAILAWIFRATFLQKGAWAWLGALWVTAALVVGTGWYGGSIVWDELEPVEFDRSGFGPTTTTQPTSDPSNGTVASTSTTTSSSTATGTTTASSSQTTTASQASSSSSTTTSSSPPPSGYTGQETGQTNSAGLPIWELFVETNDQTGSYGYSPADIIVPTNHEIRLHYGNFDPENRRHDIWVGESASIAKTAPLNAGQTDTITFTVGGAMTTIFYCDVGNHRTHGMIGDFVVQ